MRIDIKDRLPVFEKAGIVPQLAMILFIIKTDY
jgi:hypothetical protein